MAEVKRSLSAVETRHGGPKYETSIPYHPSSLGRSASSLQTPARNHLLHPYTTISQSRALMYGPSTSSPDGASRPVDEVPATPTPAPKYLSDKSRGKRKADDLDTTPPEQKKEGQRATFVIPSETRSECSLQFTSQCARYRPILNIQNKVSGFLTRRTRRLRTTENAQDCRLPLRSLPLRLHDRRRFRNNLGAANISLGRVVLALVALLFAHLRVLHPLIHNNQINIYLTPTKKPTTVTSPCRKDLFQSVLLSRRMHLPSQLQLNSICEILESPPKS